MKNKIKRLLTYIIVPISMLIVLVFSVLFIPSTSVSASTPEIISVELSAGGKVPTIGEKIFYPEIVSVNGDESLKNLVRLPTENHIVMSWDAGTQRITDENYVFQEGVRYTFYVQLAKNPAGTGLLDKDVVVSFAGKTSNPKDKASILDRFP